MKKVFVLIPLLISINVFSQNLPISNAGFNKMQIYERVGTDIFAELARTTFATTEASIIDLDPGQAIMLNSSFFGGTDQVYFVKNADKLVEGNMIVYLVDTNNMFDPEKKTQSFIIEFENARMVKFIVLADTGTVVFYRE